jgi:hypothetical protein
MRRKSASGLHALVDVALRVTRAVVAPLGVVADEALERRTHKAHFRREFEQAQEGSVPGHEAQVLVDQRETLVDQIERRLQ